MMECMRCGAVPLTIWGTNECFYKVLYSSRQIGRTGCTNVKNPKDFPMKNQDEVKINCPSGNNANEKHWQWFTHETLSASRRTPSRRRILSYVQTGLLVQTKFTFPGSEPVGCKMLRLSVKTASW